MEKSTEQTAVPPLRQSRALWTWWVLAITLGVVGAVVGLIIGIFVGVAVFFVLDIISNCTVHKVRMEHGSPSPTWVVENACGVWRSQVVVIATGHYGVLYLPQWTGIAKYKGQLLHSVQYKTGRDYAGKRALVIGAGNSGAEIATDLAEQGAAFVACSIRTPPPVAPLDLAWPTRATLCDHLDFAAAALGRPDWTVPSKPSAGRLGPL